MQTPQNATVFEFLKRDYEEGNPEIVFSYRVHFTDAPPLDFVEKITLSDAGWTSKVPLSFIEQMLDGLHIVLGISYYKLFVPPAFKTTLRLTEKQAVFFNTLYTKGLGEFVYRNNLSFSAIASFVPSSPAQLMAATLPADEHKVLIGIGGGKDSIVSLELLKTYNRMGFEVATSKESPIVEAVAAIAGVPLVKTKRTLDPKVLAGIEGSYNGHVPISSVYAFLGVFEAALQGAGYVVVSNEHSSNFGNVVHEGVAVNHKWSGSVEFERLFQEYVRECITPDIRYFSLTRPFYELRVVRQFAAQGAKYFHTFSSCNRNFAHDHDGKKRWCGECPKCAFAFLSLAAFLPHETLVGIFNKDLFEDETLLPLFTDLLGYGTLKPFDCVGTFEESRAALKMASENGYGSATAVRALLPLLSDALFSDEVMKVQKADTVPSRFRMLGMESALILGYGREGHATEQYLRVRYPALVIGVSDQTDGEAYLEKQHAFDITVRTPVIPPAKVVRQCTTATQLFFAEVGKGRVIGVTGSKGKSTTATLMYRMLQKAGVRVRLVGNIGTPALSEIMSQPPEEDEFFVFELSSYQLEDLDVSPHLAVVTSLFPEHLDHHITLEAYYNAKKNIINFQDEQDFFVFAEEFPLLEKWAEETKGASVALTRLPFTIKNKVLRGAHMKINAELAYTVGVLFGLSVEDGKEVLETFEGLPHRLQHVGTFKKIEFYDDSISTTPEAAIAGIRAIGNVDTILLGGVDRGYAFELLEKEVRAQGIRNIVLFPDSGAYMFASEEGFTVLHTSSMEEAVQFAYAHTREGKSCLLSPAAPSYNLFTNFEARGEAFAAAVLKYGTV